jgi:hypothetical protein
MGCLGTGHGAWALPASVDGDADGHLDGIETRLGSDAASATSTPEHVAVPPSCGDGNDNDGDGQTDVADAGCKAAPQIKGTFPPGGLDAFDSRINLDGYALVSSFGTCSVDFDARGPTVVVRGDPSESGGSRNIPVEIVALQLSGMATVVPSGDCTLPAGTFAVTMFEDPAKASTGEVRRGSGAPAGMDFPADSFFDVFFQIDTPAGVLPGGPPNGPAGAAVRVTNTIEALPPYQTPKQSLCYAVPGLAHEHCPKAPPDHFKCYSGRFARAAKRRVTLTDQFGTTTSRVLAPRFFCTPAAKNGEPLYDESTHLECYALKPQRLRKKVVVYNQFGREEITTKRSELLCLPSRKNQEPEPQAADHYKCYTGTFPRFAPREVTLVDQFVTERTRVTKPRFVCNPVDKNGEGINDRLNHLKCYTIRGKRLARSATVTNQFRTGSVRTRKAEMLCVPSMKFDTETTTTTTTSPPQTTTTTTLCFTAGCPGRSVTAARQLGPVPQGNAICLSQIQGGCVAGNMEPGCSGHHLHNPIAVQGQTGTIPDQDPTGCGHGLVGNHPACAGQPDSVPDC